MKHYGKFLQEYIRKEVDRVDEKLIELLHILQKEG